jgi:hypothetical protein
MSDEGGSDASQRASTGGGDGSVDSDAEPSAARSPLARRWLRLDRGWQALCLGLVIVAVHAVVFPV